DAQMVPVAQVPPQEIGPWVEALSRLISDREHWEENSRESRRAALSYAADLHVGHFEELLTRVPKRNVGQCFSLSKPSTADELSPERRELLALRLRKRAPAAA